MMKRLLIGLSLMVIAPAALGQTAPASGSPAATSATPITTPSPLQQLHAQCKADAAGQGLKGPARKDAVQACMIKARPGLAKAIECRKDGLAKGLAGDALHAFVRSCRKGG